MRIDLANLRIMGRYLVLLLGIGATVASFAAPPTKLFMQPELARILFFHLPCAFMSVVMLFMATIYSIKVMSGKDAFNDAKANAAMELTGLFCVLTMVTGMIFSKAQWGAWWQGDPRQTSFLIVLLIVGAYSVLRMTLVDEEKRRAFSAAYVVGSLIPNLALIFVLPRLPQVMSFHPSNTLAGGKLDGMHWTYVLLAFVAIGFASIWAFRLRLQAAALELELENYYGDLENSSDASAATRVVRPVRIHDASGQED